MPDDAQQAAANPSELPSQYRPADHEPAVIDRWNEAGAFHADPERVLDGEARPYSILIPPPNVTAALHLGHALNNSLQDILIRYHRLRGFETLWMPGTDHAGIATQTVVDRRLKADGKPALAEHKQMELAGENGREKFIAEVQAFKDEYEARITEQLVRMGCSCDWDRQRFTMDDVCARAVREAFFRLFKDGLIYRGKRLVNWDPVTQTALADDEVENKEVEGAFYYLRYPLVHPPQNENDPKDVQEVTWSELAARGYPDAEKMPEDDNAWITVATTRPETYLGDTGVAVNPKDPRAGSLRGLMVQLPLVGRVIPIVEDDYVVLPVALGGEKGDPKAEFATGFLKVTPAHDTNDWDIGQRHNLDAINVMAPDASISPDYGWADFDSTSGEHVFVGKSREDARELVVREFRTRDLLEQVKPYSHSVGHSYRSHAAIEPYLSDQWYVKVTDDKLRGAALEAMQESQRTSAAFKPRPDVEPDGSLTFYPDRYAKTYETWHENLRDWCISRQLWWGHRIPVWSQSRDAGSDQDAGSAWEGRSGVAVARTEHDVHVCLNTDDEALAAELESQGFTRDPDVLDTWFSSALWPLSTMGWPDAEAAASDTSIAGFTTVLDAFNPTNVLCTAREIITLWVSRMVMFQRYFKDDAHGSGELPFTDVFIHAMIQDGEGRKMSKSLGNGVDPLDIIKSHGADAMRFTLCQMTTQTQDVRMPVELDEATGHNTSPKFDLGRNFCNKLWNATRFTMTMLGEHGVPDATVKLSDLSLIDRWMLSRLASAVRDIDAALSEYQFNPYAERVYDLLWRDFCDWYLEGVKPTIAKSPAQRAVLRTCLDVILRVLHPICPFITETLHASLASLPAAKIEGLELDQPALLCRSAWPQPDERWLDDTSVAGFERVRALIGAIREVRSDHKVPPRARITLHASGDLVETAAPAEAVVLSLAGLETITPDGAPGTSVVFSFEGVEHALSGLSQGVDKDAEKERLGRQLAELKKAIGGLEGRLNNPGYVDKAPEKLVNETRAQLAEKQADLQRVEQQLEELA